MNWRISAQLVASFLLCAATSEVPPTEQEQIYLISLQGITLEPDEFVSGFSIDTWGVRFRMICHIPPGWYIKAGGTASFDGALEGKGTHSVTYLGPSRLDELNGLALIALDGPVQEHKVETRLTFVPPTFDGTITVSRMAEIPPHPRTIPLKFANFRLVPANRCPQ